MRELEEIRHKNVRNSIRYEKIKLELNVILENFELFDKNAKNIHVFQITDTEVFIGYDLGYKNFHYTQIPIKLK